MPIGGRQARIRQPYKRTQAGPVAVEQTKPCLTFFWIVSTIERCCDHESLRDREETPLGLIEMA
jgi:hypothetical protein